MLGIVFISFLVRQFYAHCLRSDSLFYQLFSLLIFVVSLISVCCRFVSRFSLLFQTMDVSAVAVAVRRALVLWRWC